MSTISGCVCAPRCEKKINRRKNPLQSRNVFSCSCISQTLKMCENVLIKGLVHYQQSTIQHLKQVSEEN